ncbi:MAG: prepilin-type N-terminal cleavage/methylation domain-containing protein [Betaproteobacteria bacterium]|jgi:prepilin-type N-terminal cleavage/methylation domain-containing protein|nr:MAG: prepilin-type N-terminal cleavage/methylation domain-containing protein [Betaproteobacteria bacterium]
MMHRQTGFTLIEIAIVLVIIGLLLGGVLKGQELITSARVRNLISQQDGVKAAFFGFQDRFRAYPGDYAGADQNIPNIGTACGVNGNGNGNGRIEAGDEAILSWEHLSKAGFITGTYTCSTTETNTTTPKNPYNIFLQLVYDDVYGGAVAQPRHNVKTGSQIPVELLAEMDRKIDDGLPNTGGFRFSAYAGQGTAPEAGSTTACTDATTATGVWNGTNGNTNCGAASLL